ncbi:putative protein-serine/threonine phosphatase [Helianthus anomalus]
MPERDYALEMWRLLDTGTHLITPKQLLNRVDLRYLWSLHWRSGSLWTRIVIVTLNYYDI